MLPFLILRLAWRGFRAPAYWRRWSERFIGSGPPSGRIGGTWLHAVSLGEVQAAAPLIERLLHDRPEEPLLVTTMTPTGSQRLRELFGERVDHVYLPYDYPPAVARFLERTRPRQGILMETELWPNLLHACRRRDIPVLLVNARLSARSAAGYRKIGSLIRPALASLELVAAQTEADAVRFQALGMARERLHVIGNLKFDLGLPPGIVEQGLALRRQFGVSRRISIAASTHEGEEEQVLQAFGALRDEFPDLLLVLVPRHPERFNRVAALCRRANHSLVRRSQQPDGQPLPAETEIYLGDSMGELPLLYAASDLTFVGGSLIPVGGHNPLEPAALGLPVIVGPHTFNFEMITRRLLEVEAARQIRDADELAQVLRDYLRNPEMRQRQGKNGRNFVAGNRGALQRLLALLEEHPGQVASIKSLH